MLIFGFVGVALALAIMATVRPWFSEVAPAPKHLEGSGGADTLKNRNTILLVIMSAAYGLVIYGFLGTFPSFMRTVLEMPAADVGAIGRPGAVSRSFRGGPSRGRRGACPCAS